METLLFNKLQLDDKVIDCPYPAGVNLRPILEKFGKDVTWRTVLEKDTQELYDLPGYGRQNVDRLYIFISGHVQYSFMDFI